MFEGVTASALQLTKTIPSAGFETDTIISNSTKFVQVGALCSIGDGKPRNSTIVSVS